MAGVGFPRGGVPQGIGRGSREAPEEARVRLGCRLKDGLAGFPGGLVGFPGGLAGFPGRFFWLKEGRDWKERISPMSLAESTITPFGV
eukprot:222208-Prorocentrum_minimum.AAC.3